MLNKLQSGASIIKLILIPQKITKNRDYSGMSFRLKEEIPHKVLHKTMLVWQ